MYSYIVIIDYREHHSVFSGVPLTGHNAYFIYLKILHIHCIFKKAKF